MGCDTRADYGGTALFLRDGKIGRFKLGGGREALVAVSGSGAALPLMRRAMKFPDPEQQGMDGFARDPDRWASEVAHRMTTTLAEATPPLTVQDSEGATSVDCIGLLAYRNHLWLLQTHSAVRPNNRLLTVGSGIDLALGALHVAIEAGYSPEDAVGAAVRLACEYGDGCGVDERGPLIFSTTD